MYELSLERDFSAAHCLRGHTGDCAQVHGHNYLVRVTVCGEALDELGMLMDFGDLGEICEAVLDRLDHSNLNEIPPFDETNPTSENLARHVYEQVAERLPEAVRVSAVTVHESTRSSATWREV